MGTSEPGLFIWLLHELIGLPLIDTGQFSQRVQGALQDYRSAGQSTPLHTTSSQHNGISRARDVWGQFSTFDVGTRRLVVFI